jgi:hypothetical protein
MKEWTESFSSFIISLKNNSPSKMPFLEGFNKLLP